MLIEELMNTYSKAGKVIAISIRAKRKVSVLRIDAVKAIENIGLEGDRSNGGNRQVTLIQKEHIDAIASFLGKQFIDFELTRRNILVEGINLLSLKGKQFQIGSAIFKYSGECHPCSRMEEALGVGGYNAMRGHGGITAKIIASGHLEIGDELRAIN